MSQNLTLSVEHAPINTEIIKIIEEVFWDNLLSIGYFWSRTRGEENLYSDTDFIIILKWTDWVDTREANSPKIKQIMRERGISDLGAFNIYNQQDVLASPTWIRSILQQSLMIVSDKENILKSLQSGSNNAYSGIAGFPRTWHTDGIWKEEFWLIDRTNILLERLERRIVLLQSFPALTRYYYFEKKKLTGMKSLLEAGIFTSSLSSFSNLHKLLTGNGSVPVSAQEEDYEYKMLAESLLFKYDNDGIHEEISSVLWEKDTIWGLQHMLIAVHIEMRKLLHNRWKYIIDGELTQMYLQQTWDLFAKENLQEMWAILFKAEQVCGRTDLITFDIDENWPVYADYESEQTLRELLAKLKRVLSDIKVQQEWVNYVDNTPHTEVSILTPSYNRSALIRTTQERVQELIFPHHKIEYIVVDDGSEPAYTADIFAWNSLFPCKLVRKKHSWVTDTRNLAIDSATGKHILFLDDDVHISPLTLLRLLWKIKNTQVGMVGGTTHGMPDARLVPEYAHYRWLLSWPLRSANGDILNIPTCCALINRAAANVVGWFSTEQWSAGITFWGEDIDLSYRLSLAGYTLAHEPRATVFHAHRSSIKELAKQHVGYWEWCSFHCIERWRDHWEIGIPYPNLPSVILDAWKYLFQEIPKRFLQWMQNGLWLKRTLQYLYLDMVRMVSYNYGVLKTKHLIK